MLKIRNWCFAALTAAAAVAATNHAAVAAAEWGTVEGQFVLDGEAPDLPPRVNKGDQAAKDAAVCAADGVANEALVVDADTKGIANIIIYLRKAPANVHPDLKASAVKEIEFDQQGCRYIPHVLHVRTDQAVKCVSSDAVSHNVHTNPLANEGKNFIVPPNSKEGSLVTMKLPENLPVRVTCDIHPWMESYWVVTDHPYAAITDAQGKFKIENLPVGKHKFTVWHESKGYLDRNFEIDVKAGDNTVPVRKVKVTEFKLKK
jgi:hypothetical protein